MTEQTGDCLGAEGRSIGRYLAKAAQSRIPLSVSLELTRRCSFRCVHCYLGEQESIRRHRQREIDTATVLRLIDDMAAAGTLLLTLTGGDPMLRSDFLAIYCYAVRKGLLVTVFCSGALITDEIVRTFVQYPPRAVEITLYGARQETFEAVTQQPGSFAACMKGVEQLHKATVRLRLKTMVLSLNQDDLPALWNMAEDIGVPFRHDCSVIPALPHDDNSGRSNAGNTLRDTLRFRIAPEQAAAADLGINTVREKLREQDGVFIEPSNALYRCGAGRCSCHVTSYGTMLPCLVTMQPSCDLIRSQQGFSQAWESLSRQFIGQQAGLRFVCNSCKDRSFCTGCPSSFLLETGDPEQPASFYCQYAAGRRTGIAACGTVTS